MKRAHSLSKYRDPRPTGLDGTRLDLSPGKYQAFLKPVKARANHKCAKCGTSILSGEIYFREAAVDRFLQSLHSRAFCRKCYDTGGNALLAWKERKSDRGDHGLSEFISVTFENHKMNDMDGKS